MTEETRLDLQFFAEGAETGEAPAAAGQEERATEEEMQDAAAFTAVTQEEAVNSAPARMSWEEIMADPEYNRQMQAVVQARLKEAKKAKKEEQRGFEEHFKSLEEQARELKRTFPDFDLMTELKNPVFARMTSPSQRIGVEDAYYAIHRKEIQRMTADRTAEKIASSIQSSHLRPDENGVSRQAPFVTAFDYRNASRSQRDALKKRILEGSARGEKVYPGQEFN